MGAYGVKSNKYAKTEKSVGIRSILKYASYHAYAVGISKIGAIWLFISKYWIHLGRLFISLTVAQKNECRKYVNKIYLTSVVIYKIIKKDRWDPPTKNHLFCDIQIKMVINCWQIYVCHTDILPCKIWVTLTLTVTQGQMCRCNCTSRIWFSITC